MDNNDLITYTPKDVAEILHITRQTVYNYLKTGQLKGVHFGRDWRITKKSVEDFLETGTSDDYYEKLIKIKGNSND